MCEREREKVIYRFIFTLLNYAITKQGIELPADFSNKERLKEMCKINISL